MGFLYQLLLEVLHTTAGVVLRKQEVLVLRDGRPRERLSSAKARANVSKAHETHTNKAKIDEPSAARSS